MKNILARGGVEFIAVLLGISLSLYIDKQSELNTKSLNEKNLLLNLIFCRSLGIHFNSPFI